MNSAKFFIDRPIFATVISIITLILGVLAYNSLPIEQYPRVAPPTIQVIASFPGADAKTVAETVATPIEQEINGVEGMLYMLSQSTADGQMSLTITFEIGTDLDIAQVLVQNRVAVAEPRLPEEVRRLGVITRKNSPDLMLVINMYSPNDVYDRTYIANYAVLKVRDQIRRIDGVGRVFVFGGAEYAMRIWLDPDLIQSYDLTVNDVLGALRAQNIQVASGVLNQSPQEQQNYYEYSVRTLGRLIEPEQFENIIVKSGENGRIVKLKDIARVELGAQSYVTRGYLGQKTALALPIFQRPGTNALQTADEILKTMKTLKKDFPPGLEYEIVYNPTTFIEQSIQAVQITFLEAILLVVLVIIIFLQTWRAAIIPIVAIPVSIIGTFAVMAAFGFSINNLTLFGLVLAIGVVVDDAIVVIENMERNMRKGLQPKAAARKTLDEVGSALIATSLVLVAVFLPTIFLGGITGKFYQQFGVTIAVATVISTIVSLTLSPALAAIIMKPNENEACKPKESWRKAPLKNFFCWFNFGLDKFSRKYSVFVRKVIRQATFSLLIYAGLMGLTTLQFNHVPKGFIPQQDQGYFIVALQLPSGAALSKTDDVVRKTRDRLLKVPGVKNTVAFAGFSGATFTNATNAAVIFTPLEDFDKRTAKGISYHRTLREMQKAVAEIKDAFIVVIPPPPVRGIGNSGGFRMMIQDRSGRGLNVLEGSTWALAGAANQNASTNSVFTFFENKTPQLYLDINREKAERLNVRIADVFQALEVYLGSTFVNDFNYQGRTFRVTAQADAPYRLTVDDALRIRVRSGNGNMVPLGSIATIKDATGPNRVPRYNLYPSAALIGNTAPGYSTGDALDAMERLAAQVLPDGVSFEWTDIAYQERQTGNTASVAFLLAVIFVFLLLAAQYESWTLPLAIILIVPMCLLSAITGIWVSGMDNNILTQIGFVVLIGLASKNAILIVEFAKQLEDQGMSRFKAAIEASKLRLRPILMTSFSFILGVTPLVFATGAAAEMRRALGVAVFSGMIGVTIFGLIFTPIFYVLCRKLSALFSNQKHISNEKS